MRLHNSYTNQIEQFETIEPNKVKMYVCGPTVYDNAHLGHARCYITWDVLYRYLKFKGYDVTYCRNVTDVDDKILKKADTEGKTPEEVSTFWYNKFSESMKALNNLKPDIEPFATKTLGEMIAINKDLINKGFAYESNGDVYFRVKEFPKYGYTFCRDGVSGNSFHPQAGLSGYIQTANIRGFLQFPLCFGM